MALVDVTIQSDGSGGYTTAVTVGGVTTVNPTLRKNVDDIRWINGTAFKAFLFFPHDNVLGDDDSFHQVIHPGKKHRRTGPDNSVGSAHYLYSIFCNGKFAHGSDLEIIVQ